LSTFGLRHYSIVRATVGAAAASAPKITARCRPS